MDSLEKGIALWRHKVSELERQLAELKAEWANAPQAINEYGKKIDQLKRRREELYEQRIRKPGLLGVVGLTERTREVQVAIDNLNSDIAHLEWRVGFLRGAGVKDRVEQARIDLEKAGKELKKFERAAEIKRRKDDSVIALKAKAAANVREVRVVAVGVKAKLERHPFCPYCGNALGEDAHADHIYPVAEGGRSVPSNMVYVCSKCNGLKRDLTLRAFILKFSLDREAIERRLAALNKKF